MSFDIAKDPPPPPPPASVRRVNPDGTPTAEWIAHERARDAWLKRVIAALQG